jgi:hypothetical protein
MNTSLVTQNGVQNSIEEILGLNDMPAEEQQLFLASVGALIIESAVLKYVVGISSELRDEFAVWLEENQKDESLLERSFHVYPAFAEVLTEEMGAFQSEALRLFGVTA